MAYVAVKGGERAIDNAHAWLAEERRGDPAVPTSASTRSRATRPRGRPGDGGGLAVRSGTGRAGDQAGAGRPDRGRVPAARLSHHAAALRPCAAGRYRGDAGRRGGSRRSSRICRAGRCWARPTTTRTGCWISSWLENQPPPDAARAAPDHAADAACARHSGPRGAAGTRWRRSDARTRRPDPRAAAASPPTAMCACRPWRAAMKGSCWAMGYSTQRGYGGSHPFAGEVRMGEVSVEIEPPELGFAIDIGDLTRDRMPDGQPVQRLENRAAAVHPRLRPGLRLRRAQGDVHGPGRSRHARRRNWARTSPRRRRTRIRSVSLRQHRGDRLR